MARRRRTVIGGCAYHVCNRGSRKGVLFETSDDFDNFEQLMNEARAKRPMRITGYNLMRTHVHFLLWPREDGDLSRFMHWLSGIMHDVGIGNAGQLGRSSVPEPYVSVPITDDRHLLSAWRYIEKNALEAGLVKRAEDWRWCSAWQAVSACPTFVVDEGPIPRPSNWLDFVNDSIGEPPHAESEALMTFGRLEPGPGVRPQLPTTLGSDPNQRGPWRSGPTGHVPDARVGAANDSADHARRAFAGVGERGHDRFAIRLRHDEHQAHPHVERAQHVFRRHAARPLQPSKECGHLPCAEVNDGLGLVGEHSR